MINYISILHKNKNKFNTMIAIYNRHRWCYVIFAFVTNFTKLNFFFLLRRHESTKIIRKRWLKEFSRKKFCTTVNTRMVFKKEMKFISNNRPVTLIHILFSLDKFFCRPTSNGGLNLIGAKT